MKKTQIIFAIVVATMLLLGTRTQAQDEGGKILAGGGLGYATEINNLAIFANGVYQITDEWEGSLGISYYLPKDTGIYKLTWMGFDLDAHYVFSTKEKLDFYGLAGLHITRVSIPSYNVGGYKTPSASNTETGLNLGAGGRYQISDNLYGLGEAKYVIANGGFLQINVGVLFRF